MKYINIYQYIGHGHGYFISLFPLLHLEHYVDGFISQLISIENERIVVLYCNL